MSPKSFVIGFSWPIPTFTTTGKIKTKIKVPWHLRGKLVRSESLLEPGIWNSKLLFELAKAIIKKTILNWLTKYNIKIGIVIWSLKRSLKTKYSVLICGPDTWIIFLDLGSDLLKKCTKELGKSTNLAVSFHRH